MTTRTCYHCPHPAHGHSAYCQDCNQQIRNQHKARGQGPVPKGSSRCSACGNTFRTLTGFDAHQPGQCLDPATLGLTQVNRIWATPEGHAAAQQSRDKLSKARAARQAVAGTDETGPRVSG